MEHPTRKDVSLRNLVTLEEMEAAEILQAQIWGYGRDSGDHPYPSRALFSLSESGGLVSGAFHEGKLVAFAAAWLGRWEKTRSYYLHSQLLGVLPEYRRMGLGFRLKLHQRDFALKSQLSLVRWTFDPLKYANARFNLQVLGAVGQTYSANHYGVMRSHLGGNLPSDRLWADWYIDSARVRTCLEKRARHRCRGLPMALHSGWKKQNGEHLKRPMGLSLGITDTDLLVEIPVDFDLILQKDSDLAGEWRSAVREVLRSYLSRGYIIDDCFSSSGAERLTAFYHLSLSELHEILDLSGPKDTM